MPTLKDLIEALGKRGIGRIITVGFGLMCLIIINLFNSHSSIDWIGNAVFGTLIMITLLFGRKKE